MDSSTGCSLLPMIPRVTNVILEILLIKERGNEQEEFYALK